MILDLDLFIRNETAFWQELERMLDRSERDAGYRLSVTEVRRLHYLYQRAGSDLARIQTFADEPATRRYLEDLVARAYAEIHENRERAHRFRPLHWFTNTFPQTFRRHWLAFVLTVAATLAGSAFGAFTLWYDPPTKDVIIPPQFGHLSGDPSERVRMEEEGEGRVAEAGEMGTFSAFLMTHNTKVSIMTMTLGIFWGLGSLLMLFYNGVLLGGVTYDYVQAGETPFLVGWLLPHGAIEIPAILLAGQAGLVLGYAVIGWGAPVPMRQRLREAAPDVVTLILGVAVLLVWAGLVEAFFSQIHEPYLPYAVKIAFGLVELIALFSFLGLAGRSSREES
ncbi:MAG: stage II sporulation protein M [Candidatus Hydrogenedentes bacterium]|nr:stage II sporulation protein M [Candidatus Hydrogenedentota bacterium]